MLLLALLLVPACLGAPPGNPHTQWHASLCANTYCRVSNETLDSALETFLCMKKDDMEGLREKEKKFVLAQKLAPLLKMKDGSSVVDELAKMDTARLVPLVNLILHDYDADAAVEPKTEEEYSDALVERLSSSTSLCANCLRSASPIVLGILNCQTKLLSTFSTLIRGYQRNGRFLDQMLGEELQQIGPKIETEIQWLKMKLEKLNMGGSPIGRDP